MTQRFTSACLFVLFLSAMAQAQTALVQERTKPIAGGGFTVVLDAVITDGGNRIVKDISVEDLEIWEDGVLQKIDTCRFLGKIQEENPVADVSLQLPQSPVQIKPDLAAREEPEPRQARRIIALLLDYGGADITGQNLIDRAVGRFIDSDIDEQDLVGIFSLDPTFRILSDFTQDRAALKKALSRRRLSGLALARVNPKDLKDLLPWTPALTGDDSGFQAGQLLSSGALTAGGAPGDPAPDVPIDVSVNLPAQAGGGSISRTSPALRMVIGSFVTMLTQIQRGQAYEHLAALRAIFAGIGPVEARKAVVFFSSGFVVDSATEIQLNRVIGAANRADVVVYAIDPQGLSGRGTSSSLIPRGELAYIGSAHQGPNAIGGESLFDRARIAGTDVRDSVLRYLTAQTGGFAIRNTNDLYPGLARVKEEVDSYYLLSYRPERQTYDGLFRKVEIRARKSGLTIRFRPGYVALPQGYETLTSEEFKLVKAAEQGPSSPWPLFIEADTFYPRELSPNVLVTVEVPFRQLQLVDEPPAQEKSKRNRGPLKNASVYFVGLLRDSSGAVLQRFGEPMNLHLDAKRIAELRDGQVSFTYEFTLLPGRYSLLVYADDRNAPQNHAVIEQTVSVRPISEGLQASSLVLGRHVERTRSALLSAAGGIKVSPSAERTFRPGERAVAFLKLYNFGLDNRGYYDLDVRFTLKRIRSGQVIQTRPLRLSERSAEEADLPVMRFFELAGLPQGTYLLEARVEDRLKGASITRGTHLTVAP